MTSCTSTFAPSTSHGGNVVSICISMIQWLGGGAERRKGDNLTVTEGLTGWGRAPSGTMVAPFCQLVNSVEGLLGGMS